MKENIHSKNIAHNKNIFAVIYDSTAPAGTGFGVYLKGTAVVVTNPIEIFMKRFPRRLYKFVPEIVWVNGDGTKDGDFVDIRTEIPLLTETT